MLSHKTIAIIALLTTCIAHGMEQENKILLKNDMAVPAKLTSDTMKRLAQLLLENSKALKSLIIKCLDNAYSIDEDTKALLQEKGLISEDVVIDNRVKNIIFSSIMFRQDENNKLFLKLIYPEKR